MASATKRREGAGISATTLLQCPRQTILKETEDYYESPADYHARWRGTGVHAMAEVGGPYPDVVQERRIRKGVVVGEDRITITGQPDWYDRSTRHLDDWKSTSSCPTTPYDDHIAQLNIYAWLIDGGTWDGLYDERCFGDKLELTQLKPEISTDIVESASIIYIDPKRSVRRDVELWSSDATEAFIVRAATPIAEYYRTGTLPAGITARSELWKRRFCPFSGSGKCCGDNNGNEENRSDG